jgi:rhodanese-related sulfurtransferase
MKIIISIMLLFTASLSIASTDSLEKYISSFNYEDRKEMKITSEAVLGSMQIREKIFLIDIRFPEEYKAWNFYKSINIPLNKLPNKIKFLQKKVKEGYLIVTTCPHKDRAIIAMTYLRSKGIKAKYIVDGLIGLMENLRGDNARDFINEFK